MTNNILPDKYNLVELKDAPASLDLKAICAFVAFGFFLDDDTYWINKKMSSICSVGEDGLSNAFKWHYTPSDINFEQSVEAFINIFEKLIIEIPQGRIILPISGGLDSRTIACALKGATSINAYSYEFENGIHENKFAKQICNELKFKFREYTIPSGYLWNCIDRLAEINQCYSEFTHPRQMYVIDEFSHLGDFIIGGHGGDLFFDSMTKNALLSFDEQVEYILSKLMKKGGVELSEKLWIAFGNEGSFQNYVRDRISKMLSTINISHASAQLRAFKSKYYLPRLTMVNLQVFRSQKPVFLPYLSDEMCRFICTIPEEFLSDRKIQIEYLKQRAPELAKITWQKSRPFNLYNYQLNKPPYNIPYKISNHAIRIFNNLRGRSLIQRNWELQFLGKENQRQLQLHLFNNTAFRNFIPESVVKDIYTEFYSADNLKYSHPLSMLLTLAIFSRNNLN